MHNCDLCLCRGVLFMLDGTLVLFGDVCANVVQNGTPTCVDLVTVDTHQLGGLQRFVEGLQHSHIKAFGMMFARRLIRQGTSCFKVCQPPMHDRRQVVFHIASFHLH